MIINLISDTVTKPSPKMLDFMMNAKVGDDVFREDPTVNDLEQYGASLFEKPAALYCPSGTMTNQLAIKTHTQPMDELICDKDSHVYLYENGGYAYNSGIAISLINGSYGKIKAEQIKAVVKDDYDWLPNSKLVVLENTCNKGGGSYYTLDEIDPIQKLCKEKNLKLHLDGARLFNAIVETGENTTDIGQRFDSISICLSKGLGAPVGSLLIGEIDFIKRARKFRKSMGGGMRQAGFIAAGALYALKNNVERLKIDNDHAKEIGKLLEEQKYVKLVKPVHTNIVIFDLIDSISPSIFLDELSKQGLKASAFGPQSIRFVFHMDITIEMMEKTKQVLKRISFS